MYIVKGNVVDFFSVFIFLVTSFFEIGAEAVASLVWLC